MARKDGGESEGIVLYPSRSPSLGWKPTPLAPLVRGVKAMLPTRGFSTAPGSEGLRFPARGAPYRNQGFHGGRQMRGNAHPVPAEEGGIVQTGKGRRVRQGHQPPSRINPDETTRK